MKRAFWAAILTILFIVLGGAGDSAFGADNAAWNAVESALNLPGTLILKVVGPGHGFRQLVLPFVVSLASYFFCFWGLLIVIQKFSRQHGPRSVNR